MARTLDPASHAIRRDAFVDVALRLIQTKGYEQMSVQDLLDELDASRGAFYHYFDSKASLLGAVVDAMVETVLESVAPVVADPDLNATEKLEGVFGGIARWKSARRDLLLALMAVWLSDDNAIVREKLRRGLTARLTPILAVIVCQGRDEGRFTTTAPDETARVLVSFIAGLNEAATELYLARQADEITFEAAERTLSTYLEAFERILGARPGSVTLLDPRILHEWFG